MSTSVCVCLSARISPEPHARCLPNSCACCLWTWLGSPVAGWRNPKEKRQFWVFFPIDNALYSIAVGTHTKTAEPIEMPFGMMSGLGLRNSVLRGGDDPRRGREKTCALQASQPNWTGQCSRVHTTGAFAWLQALDQCIIGREGEWQGAHRAQSVISTTALLFACRANGEQEAVRCSAAADAGRRCPWQRRRPTGGTVVSSLQLWRHPITWRDVVVPLCQRRGGCRVGSFARRSAVVRRLVWRNVISDVGGRLHDGRQRPDVAVAQPGCGQWRSGAGLPRLLPQRLTALQQRSHHSVRNLHT